MRLTTGEVISYDKKSNWDIIIKKNAVKLNPGIIPNVVPCFDDANLRHKKITTNEKR